MQIKWKTVVPGLMVLLSLPAMWWLARGRGVESRPPPDATRALLEFVRAQPETVEVRVSGRGTVMPGTESDLVPEISGRIVAVSPTLEAGGFLERDEVLFEIDRRDYQVAVDRAAATLSLRESEYRLARSNLDRVRELHQQDIAQQAKLDEMVNLEAVAAGAVREARTALERAGIDLERTVVRAPYAGRVRNTEIDVGDFATAGRPMGRIYAIDYAEIRLPVSTQELVLLDLPFDFPGGRPDVPGPAATITADFADTSYEWQSAIVRSEGEIDPQSRMVTLVARVDDPYGRGANPDRPPLTVGLFVEAQIQGKRLDGVIVLPRAALRVGDRVLVADDTGRLSPRDVTVLRRDERQVLVRSGLEPGDLVCVSPPEIAIEGMRVTDQELTRVAKRARDTTQ